MFPRSVKKLRENLLLTWQQLVMDLTPEAKAIRAFHPTGKMLACPTDKEITLPFLFSFILPQLSKEIAVVKTMSETTTPRKRSYHIIATSAKRISRPSLRSWSTRSRNSCRVGADGRHPSWTYRQVQWTCSPLQEQSFHIRQSYLPRTKWTFEHTRRISKINFIQEESPKVMVYSQLLCPYLFWISHHMQDKACITMKTGDPGRRTASTPIKPKSFAVQVGWRTPVLVQTNGDVSRIYLMHCK